MIDVNIRVNKVGICFCIKITIKLNVAVCPTTICFISLGAAKEAGIKIRVS